MYVYVSICVYSLTTLCVRDEICDCDILILDGFHIPIDTTTIVVFTILYTTIITIIIIIIGWVGGGPESPFYPINQ